MKSTAATVDSIISIEWTTLLDYVSKKNRFKTLGKLCCIETKVDKNQIYLIYDVWEGVGTVNEQHFASVLKRYNTLKKKNMHTKVQQFQAPRWANAPDFVYSPYVAAIIHDYVTNSAAKTA